MIKKGNRWFLVGVLSICLVGLFAAQAGAWSFLLSGWGYGSYNPEYYIKGGGPEKEPVIASQICIAEAALICKNPRNKDQKDVRVGFGGTTVSQDWDALTVGDPLSVKTKNVYYVEGEPICSSTDELCGPCVNPRYDVDGNFLGCDEAWDEGPEGYVQPDDGFNPFDVNQAWFEYTWGVSENDCVNPNWTPYAFLIKMLSLKGQICEEFDIDDGSCLSKKPEIIYGSCETAAEYSDDWSTLNWTDPTRTDFYEYVCSEIPEDEYGCDP